ncbi:MAG: DEAD/DEAH box helicase [Spirochaetaceae bacterium]|nr:DEAD/DEAH box helicase [Spirochaetaceae bacterium]
MTSDRDPYSRLAPFVREYIHEKGWTRLRPIQEEAIAPILDGGEHILIASGTASGKTEAAFFPILSLLSQRPAAPAELREAAGPPPVPQNGDSLAVLYIGPLKALINDQFERLGELLARGGIPVWRWHGDVPADHKRKLLENPSGVLQITPESLEALLVRQPRRIGPLFRNLSFVIIDEVHAFMGSDRGAQLLCQINRIEEAAGCRPRRIGLSATLGDYEAARNWLCPGSAGGGPAGDGLAGGGCVLIREGESRKRVRIALDYFCPPESVRDYYEELYGQCRNQRSPRGKCIIFTNSRLEAEETIAALRGLAESRGEEDIFHVHHGSIAGTLREEAERDLREKDGPVVTAATATLELGIDIGKLDRIIQIGPPLSVASFVQRLGRSGRRSGAAEIYFTALAPTGDPETDDMDRIPWPLLRTIATVELYLEEKWMESPRERPLPYSLLCHETLSFLVSLGEQRPEDLARRVLSLPVFSMISREDYRELLRGLIRNDYIQKTDEGTLIIGLAGEPLVNHYSFYAVFPEETEYRVSHGGRELGTIHFLPPPGSTLALAGRYWEVRYFDIPGKRIFVVPAEKGGKKVWRGSGAEIHPKITRGMRRVLGGDRDYPYLSPRARAALAGARRLSRLRGLAENPFIPLPGDEKAFYLLPWLGSRGMRTLLLLLREEETRERLGISLLNRKNDFVLEIRSGLPPVDFRGELEGLIGCLEDNPASLTRLLPEPEKLPYIDKYDYLLPPALLAKQYAAHMLDLPDLKRFNISGNSQMKK